MTENREWCVHIFYVAIYVFYFRKLQEHKVWGKELPLLISINERVQKENDQYKSCRHKGKLDEYPCHLDGTLENEEEEKL